MFLKPTTTYPIGLDISDKSLKLVQLKKSGDKIKIQALGQIKLPEGYFKDGEVLNKGGVIKAINNLINKPKYGKVTTRGVIACLPETKTFIKLVEIKNTNDDIQKIIEKEIEKHVPMSLNEMYYDWQLIERLKDKQSVLIGAAPRNTVNQYTSLLDEARLSISALEIEPISICRTLLREEHEKFKDKNPGNYGVIDIGASRSNITVYSKNTILFAFSIPISGNKISKKIAETLKISFEQAEKAKIICGLDESRAKGIIKDILYGIIKDLVAKINNSIMFYNHHFPERGPINKLILCGGGAKIKNLDNIIKEYISIDVEIGNPLVNLSEDNEKILKLLSETHTLKTDFSKNTKNKSSKITQDTSITYSTAIGLALRGIFVDKL